MSEFSRHPEGLVFFLVRCPSFQDLRFRDTMLEMPLVMVNKELVLVGCNKKPCVTVMLVRG